VFVGLRSVAIVSLCVAVSAGAGSGVVARQPYLADVDPTTPGPQYDCSVSFVVDQGKVGERSSDINADSVRHGLLRAA
jgi:hypothetical protein